MPTTNDTKPPGSINWQLLKFEQLSGEQLYDLMKLRVDVFVVEQACIYPELDGLDRCEDTLHLLGYRENMLIAYARAMGPTVQVNAVVIGRVVVSRQARNAGVARVLMNELMRGCRDQWVGIDLHLSAQTPVADFYGSLGFSTVSDEYMEDGIPHINMSLSGMPLRAVLEEKCDKQ